MTPKVTATLYETFTKYKVDGLIPGKTKRIFHRVIVRIGKAELEGWPVRSGLSFSEVQVTGNKLTYIIFPL